MLTISYLVKFVFFSITVYVYPDSHGKQHYLRPELLKLLLFDIQSEDKV